MDDITHGLIGWAIAASTFRRSLGRAGIGLAVVAAELPDADVFLGFGDPWAMIQHHRGITHSVLLAPLAAVALAGIWWWFGSRTRFRMLFACALAALASHLLLDVLTSYGTRMLEPLADNRFALGWVAIIDPVVTAVLIAGLAAAWWTRKANPARASTAARMALIGVAVYLALGGLQQARASRALRHETAAFGEPVARAAVPQLGTIFIWRLLYRNENLFWVARYNSLTGQLVGAQTLDAAVEPALAPLLVTPAARAFVRFADLLVRPHRDPAAPGVLILEDMRFGWPASSPLGLWALRMEFSRDGPAGPRVDRLQFLERRFGWSRPGAVREKVMPVPPMEG